MMNNEDLLHKIKQIYKSKPEYKRQELIKIALWLISLFSLVIILLMFPNSILPFGLIVLVPVISGVLIQLTQITQINVYAHKVIKPNHLIALNTVMLNYMLFDSKTYRFQIIKAGNPYKPYQLDYLLNIHISDEHKLEISSRQISMPSVVGSRASAMKMGRYTTEASVKKKYLKRSYYEIKFKIEHEKTDIVLEGTKFGIEQMMRIIEQFQKQDLLPSNLITGTIDTN
ncbi:MAG: hypothetical protein NUK62_02530 [Tenericutes bacterium]|nr:hypothetical protein [Mycoplasmatota bacterium]